MSISGNIKRFLYRSLSLENYLRTVSRGFFAGYRLGLGCHSPTYEYPRFLKHLVRHDDTVLDIGANLGYYSRILSELVGSEGRVYAIEPVKPILGVLARNLRGLDNVEILPYALGREDKTVVMVNDSASIAGYMGTGQNRIPEDGEDGGEDCKSPQSRSLRVGQCTFGHTAAASDGAVQGDAILSAPQSRMEFEVEMRRGSELFADLARLDFIKCDIEGYEGVVIAEMAPVIREHLPIVLLETGGVNRRSMIELFREWGYAGYVLHNDHLTSVMRAKTVTDKDIVFIPGHRYAELEKLIVK